MLDERNIDSLWDSTGCWETCTLGPYGAMKLAETLAGDDESNSALEPIVVAVVVVASSDFFSSSILTDGGDISSDCNDSDTIIKRESSKLAGLIILYCSVSSSVSILWCR